MQEQGELTVVVPTTGITVCYETFGEPTGRPVLLIMGLGTQMIAWPDELCADLAGRGNYVIRFDNRDAGRSTHFHDLGSPDPLRSVLRRSKSPYVLDDMANDVLGLLDALGIPSAHVVGASMGGFIAQTLAVLHPRSVRSLTLIMTSTGSRRVGRPRARLVAGLARRRKVLDRAGAIAAVIEIFHAIGSPGFPFDEARVADLAGRAYDRSYDPGGYLRQLAAILAQPDRTRRLSSVKVPTVVIHGLADPLVGVTGGLAIAKAIPGARFVGLEGMGHDLPAPLLGRIAEEISTIIEQGESKVAVAP